MATCFGYLGSGGRDASTGGADAVMGVMGTRLCRSTAHRLTMLALNDAPISFVSSIAPDRHTERKKERKNKRKNKEMKRIL